VADITTVVVRAALDVIPAAGRAATTSDRQNPRRIRITLMGRTMPSPASAALRDRRRTLRRLMACLLGGTAGWISVGHGKDKKRLVCADPSAMSQAENRQRKLDNYTERSLDPGKTCRGCGFFTAGATASACGKCQIFNGPANPKGKCDDWVAVGNE